MGYESIHRVQRVNATCAGVNDTSNPFRHTDNRMPVSLLDEQLNALAESEKIYLLAH